MKDAVSYRVTIQATVQRVEVCGKEWKPTMSGDGAPYAYTPETEKTVTRTLDVYEQVVDSLDVRAVIDAVNKEPKAT